MRCVPSQPVPWDILPHFEGITKAASAFCTKCGTNKELAFLLWLGQKRLSLSKGLLIKEDLRLALVDSSDYELNVNVKTI